jgi:hypothetical protein
MIKFLSSLPLVAALAAMVAAPALAADEINVSRGGTLSGPGLAVHGYDVVAYFTSGTPTLGSDKFAVAHKGGTYRFSIKANLDEFQANSAKYEPVYGGFCAYGVALGKKFDGDPHYWRIVDGRLYLNLNGDIAAEWAKDVPGNIVKAEGNWTRIRALAVEKL